MTKLPPTFLAARAYATRRGHAVGTPPRSTTTVRDVIAAIEGVMARRQQRVPDGYHYTIEDSKLILAIGKKAWRAQRFGYPT